MGAEIETKTTIDSSLSSNPEPETQAAIAPLATVVQIDGIDRACRLEQMMAWAEQ